MKLTAAAWQRRVRRCLVPHYGPAPSSPNVRLPPASSSSDCERTQPGAAPSACDFRCEPEAPPRARQVGAAPDSKPARTGPSRAPFSRRPRAPAPPPAQSPGRRSASGWLGGLAARLPPKPSRPADHDQVTEARPRRSGGPRPKWSIRVRPSPSRRRTGSAHCRVPAPKVNPH